MKRRHFALVLALALVSTLTLTAQNPPVHEKLYISLETTDTVAVVDLASFKQIKTLKVGSHPHGQAAPKSQDKLYVASEVGGVVTLIDTIKDEVSRRTPPALARNRRTGRSLRTAGSCISRRTPVTGRSSTRRRKRSSNTSTRWASGTTPSCRRTGALSTCCRLPAARGIGTGHRWDCRGPNPRK